MTFDLRLPCAEGDADDWFIGKDGKQYGDNPIVTADEMEAYLDEHHPTWRDMPVEEVNRIEERYETDAKTTALGRRRRAKEACFSCIVRTRCLDKVLQEGHENGTWGGYYEEEIRQLRRAIRRRSRGGRTVTPAADNTKE